MPKYLGGEVQLLTTKCAIAETEALGTELYGASLILKSFVVRKCGHRPNPVTASKCFMSLVGERNENRYFVATQDPDLSREVHRIPGTPLLYLNFNAIVLEKPSSWSQKEGDAVAQSLITTYEEETLKKMKRAEFGEEEKKIRRKRKQKGPNPMSVKKKKKKTVDNTQSKKSSEGEEEGKRRRKRNRVKVAAHVKEHLQQQAEAR